MLKMWKLFFCHETKMIGFTQPPDREELKKLIETELKPFAEKFGINIQLCIPDEEPVKPQTTLDTFC